MELDHECDPLEFHCAYTHKQEYVDILLHNIQSEEPSFCDEFLTGGLPAFVTLQSMICNYKVSMFHSFNFLSCLSCYIFAFIRRISANSEN